MAEDQPATMLTDSAHEIATAIRAIPLSTPHAPATQLQMYTRRHRRT
jgi:hypothetical protein